MRQHGAVPIRPFSPHVKSLFEKGDVAIFDNLRDVFMFFSLSVVCLSRNEVYDRCNDVIMIV